MIYVDSSVVLAELFAEDDLPAPRFWRGPLVSSRLLEYEVWNRVHARNLGVRYANDTRSLLRAIQLIEMEPTVLARAVRPLPVHVRTLDALHLATVEYLREQGQTIELATYDRRLAAAAGALGIGLAAL